MSILMVQARHRNRQVFVDKKHEAQVVVVEQHNVPARLQREVSLGVRKLDKDETRAWLFKNYHAHKLHTKAPVTYTQNTGHTNRAHTG